MRFDFLRRLVVRHIVLSQPDFVKFFDLRGNFINLNISTLRN